jgi:hypothetical protein
MSVDRRELLGGALGVMAAAVAGGGAQAAVGRAAATIDPVKMYRKLHYRTDDGLIFWWLQGPKYGQVGTTLTPLYQSNVGTFQRIRQLDDGGFEVTGLEINLITDVATGEPLEEFRNPYTGEMLAARFNPMGPTVVRYRPDNTRSLPTEIGGARLESVVTLHPPLVVGDDVFQRDESVARVFAPGRATPFEVNDIAVYHGSLANLSDPAVSVGEATVFFAEVTGWQRWMNMGDRPGNLTSRMTGRKVRRYEDLPAVWRERLAQRAPEIAADPVAALDRKTAAFDR